MSTRAIYSFTDQIATYHVYKHHDGYPEGAAEAIGNAIPNAWQLPRFEADEFAAAFVASNKARETLAARHPDSDDESIGMMCRGRVRLMLTGDWREVAPQDIQYRYEITCGDDRLHVKAFRVGCDFDSNEWTEEVVFDGCFTDFLDNPDFSSW